MKKRRRMFAVACALMLLWPWWTLATESGPADFDPVWPTEDYYKSGVAYVISMDRRESGALHEKGFGLDIGFLDDNTRQPIYAIESGKARAITTQGDPGLQVEIRHASGYVSTYMHLSGFAIPETTSADAKTVWTAVEKGQLIGYMGRSGNAEGSHLHIELTKNGHLTDLLPFYFQKYCKDMVITVKTGVTTSKFYDSYIDGNFVLNAEKGLWEFAGYRIRLECNGAKAAKPEALLAQPGQELCLPGLSCYGRNFLGWSAEKKGDVEYQWGTPYIFDQPMTLYAIWG